MIDRRSVTLGSVAVAAAAAVAPGASAQIAFSDPGKGPWTNGGLLRRAGGALHYAQLGNTQSAEPPVVLLHKLGGWMADWRFVAPELAKGRHVIAFDLPGHGDSRWDGAPPHIQTLAETATLLVGALDELGIAKIDLIGTSLGGCVAVPLAAYFPERVRRLALVSVALGGAKTLAEINAAKKETFFDKDGLPLPIDAESSAKFMGLRNAGPISAEQNSSRKRAGLWIQPSERGVGITNIKGLLKRIEAPTLLLYGERPNSYTNYRAGAEAELKQSRTEFIPDAGAFVMQDAPPETAAALAKFLANG